MEEAILYWIAVCVLLFVGFSALKSLIAIETLLVGTLSVEINVDYQHICYILSMICFTVSCTSSLYSTSVQYHKAAMCVMITDGHASSETCQ